MADIIRYSDGYVLGDGTKVKFLSKKQKDLYEEQQYQKFRNERIEKLKKRKRDDYPEGCKFGVFTLQDFDHGDGDTLYLDLSTYDDALDYLINNCQLSCSVVISYVPTVVTKIENVIV